MKPSDLCMAWRARSGGDSKALVRAIRDSLVSAESDPGTQIRALELLFVTLAPAQAIAVVEAIVEDARTLRRAGGGPAESVRVTTLRRRQQELEARLRQLRHGSPEKAELRHRIETLNNVHSRLHEAIAQLTDEHARLADLLQRLGGDNP